MQPSQCHPFRTGTLAALFALALLGPVTGAWAASADLHPCKGLNGARCGTFAVFEDRASRSGRKIQIAVAVIPATGPKPAEPIFLLEGGPGQSATAVAPDILHGGPGDLRKTHDIVLVDQRGTGSSNPLQCPLPATPQGLFGQVEYDPERLKACRAQLERRADLTRYTSSLAADDLDDVRAWLGYDKIVVWGGSYGTKAAMVYMRQHPAHVAAAVLDAVDSFGSKDPLFYAYGSQKGLERVFADCAAQANCAKAYPQLQQSFAKLLDRFRNGPLTAHVRTSPKAAPVAVRYSLGDFGYTVRGLLYDPQKTALLPSQVTAAAKTGNVDAFAQAYYERAHDLDQAIAGGLYLSITCAEVQPYDADEELRWTAGTFLGDYLVQDYRKACALWPRAKVPAEFFRPLESDIPTLLFSGGRDPTTPADVAEGVARRLSRSRHIVFPKGGHGNAGDACGLGIAGAFLKSKSVKALDTSCVNAVKSSVPFVVR
ncbi:MAG TPA: alpha/beta fold hydrolase [Rhizomicrobium sp.]|nr:alpha/beta fold hydrolase [Rhizomicrobium sp.]